jgi:glycine cleavage system H protein
MSTPKGFKFNKTDEWVKVDGNIAIIGISDFAQDQLSDIVYIEFNKDPGESIEKGQVLAIIESVKAAADVNSPISGKVIEVNESLSDTPEVLNDDPYENGWLFKVELNNPSELDELFDAKGYDELCESRH